MNTVARSGMPWAPALLMAAGAVVAAAGVGRRYGPQHPREAVWYAQLRKPPFTPPGAVIGAAWSVLDTLLVVSGTRLLRAAPGRTRNAAMGCWGLTVAGLGGYPWMFFGRKRLGASTAVVGGMAASAVGLVATAAQVDRPAAWASVPLVAWLAFAGLLSGEVLRRN